MSSDKNQNQWTTSWGAPVDDT